MTLGPSIFVPMDLHHLPQLGSHTLVLADYMFWPLREGFLASIQSILRLREGGLATAGPPCGSFIFLNMGTSLRSKARPFGGPWAYVKRANQPLVLVSGNRIAVNSLRNWKKLIFHFGVIHLFIMGTTTTSAESFSHTSNRFPTIFGFNIPIVWKFGRGFDETWWNGEEKLVTITFSPCIARPNPAKDHMPIVPSSSAGLREMRGVSGRAAILYFVDDFPLSSLASKNRIALLAMAGDQIVSNPVFGKHTNWFCEALSQIISIYFFLGVSVN